MMTATLKHLKLLGYNPGDRVFFRGFLPKGKDSGRKAESVFPNLPPDLQQWEREGRGVYVVVNGGGHKDADVPHCEAIFYEHDNLGKDVSADLWRGLGLPEPTLQVDTGGKSVHSYWVLTEVIAPAQWRIFQTDLLEFSDGDRSLKNPSRVMRLSGFKHPKTGAVAKIISQSGNRYDYATLRAAIPGQGQPETPKFPSWRDFDRNFSFPWPDSVPLEVCLSKSNRALLDSGVSEGRRNSSGATLARDLLGTAAHLLSLGQRFDGDSRGLFEVYCDRCSPPLPERERETIWRSAESSSPGPALSPDQIEGCVKGWAWRERRGNTLAVPTSVSTDKASGGTAGVGETPKTDLLTLQQVRQQLKRLVIEGVGETDVEIELVNLGRASGVAPRTLQGIYRALLRETEWDESTQDAIAAFDDLLKASGQTCDVGALLPSLASPLGHYAKAFNQETVTFALPLLTVAASLLSPETDLVIGGVTDYRLPPVLWGGLVAEPGSIKTPIYSSILKPLVYRQVAAKDEYDSQFEEYETAVKNFKALCREDAQRADEPKEPKLRQYYVDSATTEAVQRIVTSQIDKGLAVAVDELSGFFHGFNQYKSGKGSDRDFWKSAADGGAVKIDRVSGTQFAAKTSVSVTGTVQPEVLGGLMGAGDPDGFWSRFLWVRLPLNRLPAPGDSLKVDLTNLLHSTYRTLEELPAQSFYLSNKAKATWRHWHEWTEDRRLGTDTPVERVLYPKYRDRAGRVALVAHCLEYASRSLQPPAEIPNRTLEAAIAFVTFCLGQTRLLYSEIGLTSELTGDLLKVHDYLKRKGEPLTVADLGRANLFSPVRGRDGRKERNPKNRRDYLLPLLGKLVEQGYLFESSEKLYSLAVEPKVELVECEVEKKLSDNSTPCKARDSRIDKPKVEWLSDFSPNEKENGHSPPENGNRRDRTPQPPHPGGSSPVEQLSGHSTNGNGHGGTAVLDLAEDLLTEAALAEIDQLLRGGDDG